MAGYKRKPEVQLKTVCDKIAKLEVELIALKEEKKELMELIEHEQAVKIMKIAQDKGMTIEELLKHVEAQPEPSAAKEQE